MAEGAETAELLANISGGTDSHTTALLYGGGVALTNSAGVPWNACYVDSRSEPTADFRSNIAAEARQEHLRAADQPLRRSGRKGCTRLPHDQGNCAPEVIREGALVIEDEGIVAMLIEVLTDMGHEVGAVASNMRDALEIAQTGTFDVAIVDVNLDGRPSYPIADIFEDARYHSPSQRDTA